jgi:galactoside O-acetyltransferase
MNIFDPGYYTEDDLNQVGFKKLGKNIRISKNCTIITPENISIGNNVRIDSYCSIIASGKTNISIGNNIHIAAYCYLAGGAGIELHDFSGLSQRVSIYSKTDDYSGKYLTNPTIPAKYSGVTEGQVILKRHAIVGSGSVIFPGVTIEEGVAVGAMSLVTKSLEEWGIYFGIPAKRLKNRSKSLLGLEDEFTKQNQNG